MKKNVTELQFIAQSSSAPLPSVREVPRSLLIPETASLPSGDEDIQCSVGHGHCWVQPPAEQIIVAAAPQIHSSLPSLR